MWKETKSGLYKEFTFKDFKQAFDFMTEVGKIAQEQDHHPKWTNDYNKLEIWLSTHSAGDQITDKDRKMATDIDVIERNTK